MRTLLGTTLYGYAKNVVAEVISVGRAGTLVDWEDSVEQRAYATLYAAEYILNWQVQRINGRNIPTLVVLREVVESPIGPDFSSKPIEQIRVLRLFELPSATPSKPTSKKEYGCVVEMYRQKEKAGAHRRQSKQEWELVEPRTPLRRDQPLPLLPSVFHGPRHSRPDVDKLPLSDVICINLGVLAQNAVTPSFASAFLSALGSFDGQMKGSMGPKSIQRLSCFTDTVMDGSDVPRRMQSRS